MNAHRKSISLALAALLLLACAVAPGCQKESQNDAADVKTTFLTAYFTTNYEGRYDVWLEYKNSGAEPSLERIAEVMATFYGSVENLVSEDFYNTMLANRDIIKYDELAYESGFALAPTGFDFAEYSETEDATTYSFTAHLVKTSGDESVAGTMEGQITVSWGGEAPLITNLYLSSLGFMPDP